MTYNGAGDPYREDVRLPPPRPSASDVLLTVGLLVLGQLTTWLRLDTQDAFEGSRLLNAAVLVLGVTPILWRRSAPAQAVAASSAVLCLSHLVLELDVTLLGQFLPLVAVTASCGYHATSRGALLGAASAVVGMLVVSTLTPFLSTPTSILFNLAVLLAPWAAARALRHREGQARRLGAQLALERAASEARSAEAVRRERAAIARDLHDVVAHGVSVMVVQVGGARMQLSEDPDRAAASLLHVEEAGRAALADLRRMLGVLRSEPSDVDAGPRASLRDLDHLLQQATQAGLDVDLQVTGSLDELPAAVDVSAYRIVQEALTNVIKHSGAERAGLQVSVTGRELRLRLHDPGGRRSAQRTEVGGHGLVGVRERVAFLGGLAQIGPDEAGGWLVDVELPLTGAVPGPEPKQVSA